MAKTLTADDILPLVASLTPQERVRLLRLIALPQGGDAARLPVRTTFTRRVFGGRGAACVGRTRLGGCGVKRGEIRWYTFRLPDSGGRF